MDQIKEQRNSFIPLIKANLERRWSGGSIICAGICLPILVLISMIIPVLSGTLKKTDSLNYSDPYAIYKSVLPLNTPYNVDTVDQNPESTGPLLNPIFINNEAVYSITNMGISNSSWDATSESTMNQTITEFASDMVALDEAEYGATLVYNYNMTDINCFIFGNASSQASLPVFGTTMLQRIAQVQTGFDDLSL